MKKNLLAAVALLIASSTGLGGCSAFQPSTESTPDSASQSSSAEPTSDSASDLTDGNVVESISASEDECETYSFREANPWITVSKDTTPEGTGCITFTADKSFNPIMSELFRDVISLQFEGSYFDDNNKIVIPFKEKTTMYIHSDATSECDMVNITFNNLDRYSKALVDFLTMGCAASQERLHGRNDVMVIFTIS